MISLELLKTFCGTDEHRAILHQPTSQGEFSYATDGRVIVQVPRMAEVPEVEGFPQCGGVMRDFKIHGAWRKLPEIPPRGEGVPCEDCEGTGKFPDGTPCDECEGGKYYPTESMEVGGARLNLVFLRRIAALPNLEYNMNGGELTARSFRFDGGIGLIVPMRK
jgi:hypothetical protein